MDAVSRPQTRFSADDDNAGLSVHGTGVGPACNTQKETTMLKKLAAVLIATSMIAAPALAQGTAQGTAPGSTAPATAKAQESKPAAKTVKAKKQKKAKQAKAGKPMKAGEQPKGTSAKPAAQTTGSAPKAGN
jgi:hypothetical protein